jgi:hypothetical protein
VLLLRWGIVLALLLPGCQGSEERRAPEACPGATLLELDYVPPTTRMDILVVVDNAGSVAEQQANLANCFPELIESLLDPPEDPVTGSPEHVRVTDLHVGVVSTDMGSGGYELVTCDDSVDGDDGVLLHTPNPSITGCEDAYPPYLSYERDEPDPEWIEWMRLAFGCIETIGIDGCGIQQPLKAMRRALVDHAGDVNAGFLREGTILVVLILSRDDDCSVEAGSEALFDPEDESMGRIEMRCINYPEMLEPVESHIETLEMLRSDPRRLVLEFLVGVPEGDTCEGLGSDIPDCLEHPDMVERFDPEWGYLLPSCWGSTSNGWPGRRFVQIAQHFGESALVHSVCSDSYAPPMLEDLADVLHERVDGEEPAEFLPMETDLAACRLVETLENDSPCPEGLAELDVRGEDDAEHTQCVVPQVPASGRGWTYVPEAPVGFRIRFSGGYEPMPGSTMRFLCCV